MDYLRSTVLFSGIFGAVVAVPVSAQPEVVRADQIIVTGERLGRTLAQTASSVSVTTDDELDEKPDLDRLTEILESTPNVTLGSGGLGPTIRGQDTTGVLRDLPAFLGGNRPRTTLIVDGRPASYNEFVFGTQPLWDTARIEVFRSPQTTTQGRNSISGAIFIETMPAEQEFEAKVRAITGNYLTRQISAALTGPLITDKLAFRISGDRHRSRSSSELEGGHQSVDPNKDKYDLMRGKLLFSPNDPKIPSVEAIYSHLESQSVQIEGIRAPYRERRDTMARYGVFRTNVDSLTFRPSWSPSDGTTIKGIASFGWTDVQRFAPPGLGETKINQQDRTFEAVLRHDRDSLGLIFGANHGIVEQSQSIDITTVGLGIGSFEDRQSSIGVFGETHLRPLDRVTLTVGLRYQSDRQRRSGRLVSEAGLKALDYNARFSWFLPKISIAYEVSDQLRAGFLAQRGANPGGITLIADTGSLDIFEEETLWDYEFFIRNRSRSGKLRYEANFFYYDIANAQRSVTRTIDTPGGTYSLVEIGNVPKAWSKGAELRMTWQAAETLELGSSVGLLDTKIVSVENTGDPLLGKQFQRSPHITGNVSAIWRPAPAFSINLGYSYWSGYFDDDLNTRSRRLDGAHILNVRAARQIGPVKLYGYVRNLFDRLYLTSLDSRGLATAGDPREYGLGLETKF